MFKALKYRNKVNKANESPKPDGENSQNQYSSSTLNEKQLISFKNLSLSRLFHNAKKLVQNRRNIARRMGHRNQPLTLCYKMDYLSVKRQLSLHTKAVLQKPSDQLFRAVYPYPLQFCHLKMMCLLLEYWKTYS
ncbi:hypothetical protein CEXT_284151 [Caerostris extrusa]|uniref:Uncharacterized protein n=1 Tax=Caerostris extrusa TaxID=172846 RepID=A0AAV4P1X5_CAEEX|nr:hypothetical protein CEXT_284151 [Caerostris extrusa]